MVYTLFFSRFRDMSDAQREKYGRHAQAVRDLAATEHPGFVSQKTYLSDDGERLTVVAFRDAESQRAWKADPVHRAAQAKGRSDYYDYYRIVVCEEERSYEWLKSGADQGAA